MYVFYLMLHRYEKEYALKLKQIIAETNIQQCIRVNKESNNSLTELEKLTNLINTSNCYHQVLKEHSKSMYNQLKYLTAVELQKQNTKLNRQIVCSTIILHLLSNNKLFYTH